MTQGTPTAAASVRAEQIRQQHEARAVAELKAAEALAPGSDAVAWSGDVIAEIAVVKGLAGPAEAAGGAALSGADGAALEKALEALGWPAGSAFRTLSRPEPSVAADARAARLRAQIEAVDARTVIALDSEAADDLASAFDVETLPVGSVVLASGRRLLSVDGFEACLADEHRKRRVWKQLQAAHTEGPVY